LTAGNLFEAEYRSKGFECCEEDAEAEGLGVIAVALCSQKHGVKEYEG
jgi:hypothetical protein